MGSYEKLLLCRDAGDAERAGDVVVDVLGADRALGKTELECGAHRGVAVFLEELVQTVDVSNPNARPTMHELRDVCERVLAEPEQVFPFKIPLRTLSGHGGDSRAAMLG